MKTMSEDEFDETYGDSEWGVSEDQAQAALSENRVWTQVDSDENYCTHLMAGMHFVNAIQYVVTENPWPDTNVLPVLLDGANG